MTTGTDWPAIVAAITTGVVGIAGIGGTLWSGKRNINAENERARRAEKRLIYARCLAGLGDLAAASAMDKSMKENPSSSRATLDDAGKGHMTAYTHATNLYFELMLIAPSTVHDLAYKATTAANHTEKNVGTLIGALKEAMRADLGETD
jgi:hypothetical protein